MDPSSLLLILLGAIVGALAFALLVDTRRTRRILELTEALTAAPHRTMQVQIGRLHDRRLREGFDRLAARLGETWTLATTDLLTAVLNRQALLMRLDEELQRASRYGRSLSIVLVDLDNFKRLNDAYGHAAGDVVLHDVARVLHGNVRSVDVVGRYGGEEFMIVLPETDVDVAASIAEKLRRLVASRRIALPDGNGATITLSAGVAGGNGPHVRLDALVRDADAALYSAKSLGRDQVYVFHEVEDDGPVRRAVIHPLARRAAVEVGRQAMHAATERLTEALSSRPGWAGKPSLMIAEAAVRVAESAGLPAGEIDRIRVASLLHDLGKLAIPDEILSKPSELAEPEWRIVAEHPKIGQVVLEQAGALRDAATIVLHHHEWYDGRGYPHGLSGEEIPVGARIVAIADAYEAMVAGRPYRPAVSHEEALVELRRHAGIQFDPDLVEQFVELFEGGMPWPVEGHDHDHPHPTLVDHTSHGVIHDRLHARRRSVVRTERAVTAAQLADAEERAATGTAG